jgi:GxxExxY protein
MQTMHKADSGIPLEHEEIGRRVIGCAIEVHRLLGAGFLEPIYFKAMCAELTREGIPFEAQKVVRVSYRGEVLHEHRIDLLVAGCVVLELKAVDRISPVHIAQVVSYLRATDLRLGFVMNFNVTALNHGIRRVVR